MPDLYETFEDVNKRDSVPGQSVTTTPEYSGPGANRLEASYETLKLKYGNKDYAEVISICENLEAAGTYNADIVAVHSAALLKVRRKEEAENLLQFMLGYFPDDARLHLNFATANQTFWSNSNSKEEFSIVKKLNRKIYNKHMNAFVVRALPFIIIALAVVLPLFFLLESNDPFMDFFIMFLLLSPILTCERAFLVYLYPPVHY